MGNTTSSHISGAKKSPYGELETSSVELQEFQPIMQDYDLLKLDIEGHEAEVLSTTSAQDWTSTDAILEIGSLENAESVFEHFKKIGVNLYSQKNHWRQVEGFADMPISYKEGSLFISEKSAMPWTVE